LLSAVVRAILHVMRDRQTCVGCGKKSPETETNYTLISAQFGWRLTRYKSADGSLVIEWRCPSCWREYKRARQPSVPELSRPPTPPPAFEPFRPRTTAPAPAGSPERRTPAPAAPAPAAPAPGGAPRPTPTPARSAPTPSTPAATPPRSSPTLPATPTTPGRWRPR
jgi:hypothetical protein